MDSTFYLLLALQQAEQGLGVCAPNPAVGAVIVKQGEVIAQGYHRGPGTDHAEVDAIKQCEDLQDCTLYVTLEPCCHTGRTPPCTKAIIDAGISRVVFASHDPNRHVAETGQQVLNAAGIACSQMAIPEIERFYAPYFYWLKHEMPWLTGKLAMSFDAKIAGPGGKPVKITGEHLARLTHQCRLKADALLTTVKTVMADNPSFNVRLADRTLKKPLYILDGRAELPLHAKVFDTTQSITIFHAPDAELSAIEALQEKNVSCVPVPYNAGLDLSAVKAYLGKVGLHHVWLESGGSALSAFMQARLLDELLLYIAPRLLGRNAYRAFTQVMQFERLVSRFRVFLD